MVSVSRDPAVIVPLLDTIIATDPVRHTVLGTLRHAIAAADTDAWCARSATGFAVRSEPYYPVVLGGDWAAADHAELLILLGRLPGLAGLNGAVEMVQATLARLGAQPSRTTPERLFRLDELTEPTEVPGSARRARSSDRALLLDWVAAFAVEAAAAVADVARSVEEGLAEGGWWLWIDGRPVSVARRQAVVAGSARIGPVYTPPEARGHGYASAVTAAATRDILGRGAVPVLFTDLANATTNSIYPKLGYRPVEDRLVVRLT